MKESAADLMGVIVKPRSENGAVMGLHGDDGPGRHGIDTVDASAEDPGVTVQNGTLSILL